MPHQYRRAKVACLLLSLATVTVAQSAAELSEKIQAELARIKTLPPEQAANGATEYVGGLLLDAIWPQVTRINHAPPASPKLKVKAIFSESRQAPFIDGDNLVLPSLYFVQASEIGLLVGHDFYVANGGYISVPNLLLNAPYSSSAVLPLLEGPVNYLQPDHFAFMRPLVTCPGKTADCLPAQQAALGCGLVFLMGHELAHHFAGHGDRTGDSYPIDEELFADARGLALVKAFEQDLLTHNEEVDGTIIRSCYGSAAMILEFEESTKTGALQEALRKRKEKILSMLPEEIRDDVIEEITPDRSDQNLGPLEIASSVMPDILLIDGTSFSPAPTIGAPLLLPSGLHIVFAAKDNQYAVASIQIGEGRNRKLNLAYRALSGGQSSATEIANLRKARDWAGVLLATSDGHLHARRADLAYAHAEAMHWLKLGEWIDLNDLRSATDKERRRVELWMKISEPLSSWRR
jgi:hypothetical protein